MTVRTMSIPGSRGPWVMPCNVMDRGYGGEGRSAVQWGMENKRAGEGEGEGEERRRGTLPNLVIC